MSSSVLGGMTPPTPPHCSWVLNLIWGAESCTDSTLGAHDGRDAKRRAPRSTRTSCRRRGPRGKRPRPGHQQDPRDAPVFLSAVTFSSALVTVRLEPPDARSGRSEDPGTAGQGLRETPPGRAGDACSGGAGVACGGPALYFLLPATPDPPPPRPPRTPHLLAPVTTTTFRMVSLPTAEPRRGRATTSGAEESSHPPRPRRRRCPIRARRGPLRSRHRLRAGPSNRGPPCAPGAGARVG